MSKSAVYWGTFLIMIGILLLSNSLGAINSDFTVFIKLWPVFLILWGLSIIKFPRLIQNMLAAFSAVFLALFIFAIFTNGWSFTKSHIINFKHHQHNSNGQNDAIIDISKNEIIEFDSTIKSADLKINFGAGVLDIKEATDNYIELTGLFFELNRDEMIGNSNRIELSLSSPGDNDFIDRIKGDFVLDVSLSQEIDWYIHANLGAADVDMDYSSIKTPTVNIDCGATDLLLTLSSITPNQDVRIDCGASDITIRIPTDAGCRVIAKTFLSGENFKGFHKVNDIWETDNINNAKKMIDITLNGGVSDFKIEKY